MKAVMISYLRGKIIVKGEDFVILDVRGVGYKIFLSGDAIKKIPKEKTSGKFFTFPYLQRTTIELYGFFSQEELSLFDFLEALPRIGPKTALSLSALGSLENLKRAMERKDDKFLTKIKGMGKKRIQRLFLELTGKFKEMEKKAPQAKEEAFEALLSLGFSQTAAKDGLSKVSQKFKDPKERVKEALRILAKR